MIAQSFARSGIGATEALRSRIAQRELRGMLPHTIASPSAWVVSIFFRTFFDG